MVEWVSLKTSLRVATKEEYSCHACMNRYPGNEDMMSKLRKSKACWGGDKLVDTFNEEGRLFQFTTCPGNWTHQVWAHYLELHSAYKRGVLPYPGSLSDQPNKIMEIFGVIDQWHHGLQKERERKEDRKRSKGRTLGR